KHISEAGLGSLIPNVQPGEDPSGRKYIVMPDLGESFTSCARSEVGSDYEALIEGVRGAFVDSLCLDSDKHRESIDATKSVIQQFLSSLKTGGIADQHVLDMVSDIRPETISSDVSSMF